MLYTQRSKDLYFLFWTCSHLLPVPDSVDELRSEWYRTGNIRRFNFIDRASQMLPIGKNGLYYTRTGHLGTSRCLRRLTRTISCRGYVTNVEPVPPATSGRHIIVTQRPDYWSNRTTPNTYVVHVDSLHMINQHLQWTTVILDHIKPATNTSYERNPDRHINGELSPTWVEIDHVLRTRGCTIVYTDCTSSIHTVLDYMFIVQTRYKSQKFIARKFCVAYSSVLRIAESLLLEGILI
jgi:hypothetical protein